MINFILTILVAYILGSIPSGLLIVKAISGEDVRHIESGRTGGTNAMRAAGPFAGLLTALLDILKGAGAVWIGQILAPSPDWLTAINGLVAIVGHNYSVFLIEKRADGKLKFRGGAGGATTLGVSIGLWLNSWMIILPIAGLIYLLVGYASLTTISIALSSLGIFTVKAFKGSTPWAFVFFGFAALITVVIALRPNIQRLLAGTERRVNLIKRIFKKI